MLSAGAAAAAITACAALGAPATAQLVPSNGVAGAPTAAAAPQPPKTCYWYDGFDARGVNNTSWMGPGANGCTSGPKSKKPCTKEDCCLKCQEPGFADPTTGLPCAFSIWNPTASSCFYKTAGAVPFAKTGDTTCCPAGSIWCPSAPAGGNWKLLRDFSDEFPTCTQPWSKCAQPAMVPLNTSKWNTSVASWGEWSWDPSLVKVIGPLPTAVDVGATAVSSSGSTGAGEIPGYSGYAAITMDYEKHQRDGKTYYYKAGIMKSTLPAGVAYGRFEARIKGASRWPGVCPAFWAYRNNGEHWIELDFVEMLENSRSPKDIDFTSHVFPPTPGVPQELNNGTQKIFDFDPRDDFHVYAMEWNSTQLTWWVDNMLVKQTPSAPYFNQGWAMDVTLSFGVRPPLREQPNATGFPTTFYVDWVRVWQRE